MMNQILQFKDKKRAEQTRDMYVMKGFSVVLDTDETIMLEKTLLTGAVKWIVAIFLFPIGLVAFLKDKVTLTGWEKDTPQELLATVLKPPMPSPAKDTMTKLQEAKKMLDSNLITESEYQTMKAKIISDV